MRRLALVAFALASLSPWAPARAAFYDGDGLLEACRAPAGGVEKAACLGFIAAVFDIASTNSVRGLQACPPPGTTLQEAADIAALFLTRAAPIRHHSAGLLVMTALPRAFPCSQEAPEAAPATPRRRL